MAVDWSAVGQSAVTGGLQAAGGGLFGLIGSGIQYRRQKKLMKLANQYEIEAFNRENDRQDWLLQNQFALQKQGLRNAGLSTAMMTSNGMPGPVSTNDQGAPSAGAVALPDMGKFDLMQARLTNAQANLIDEQAENQRIKNRYEERRQRGEVGVLELDLDKYKESFREQVESIKTSYRNLTQENRLLVSRIDNFEEQTRGLSITNDFNEKTFNARAQTIEETLNKLRFERDISKWEENIKHVESQLADAGILNGQNWVQSLISLAALGKGSQASGAVADFIEDVLGAASQKLPEMFGSMIGALIGSIANMPSYIAKGLLK